MLQLQRIPTTSYHPSIQISGITTERFNTNRSKLINEGFHLCSNYVAIKIEEFIGLVGRGFQNEFIE